MEALAAQTQNTEINERRLQALYDVQTELSEIVDGSMHTEFPLELHGNDLYAPDGRGLDETTKNGLKRAEKIAAITPNMAFGVRRAIHERDERDVVIEMAKREGSNTLVVISDYPGELWDINEDIDGFNHKRKQTMMRVYVRNSKTNTIVMHSRSLDGSNRVALEAIYNRFNRQPEEGELLGQRISEDLTDEEQACLISELTGIYDRSMSSQFGGDWYAGRRHDDIRNTYEFVCRQHDLINESVDLRLTGALSVNKKYDIAATVQKRFREEAMGIISAIPRLATVNDDSLYYEMQEAGNNARYRGESFSACGVTLLANGRLDNQAFEDAGLGNEKDSNGECRFVSKECPECGAKDVLTHVTKSFISGSCGCFVKK